MSNKSLHGHHNSHYINCEDIYKNRFNEQLNTLAKFREVWLRNTFNRNTRLFQYGDQDFYFHRFTIDRLERATNDLLVKILTDVMKRYGIQVEILNSKHKYLDFIVSQNNSTIGFTFTDFYSDENVNEILDAYKVERAYILRDYSLETANKALERENDGYKREKIKLEALLLKDFFYKFLNEHEYATFKTYAENYISEAKKIIGFQSIKYLSLMNLATLKLYEEKVLSAWDYLNYTYQSIEINETTSNTQKMSSHCFPQKILNSMIENYLKNKLYKAMIGRGDFAESFITSEWLYQSLKGKENFDFTSIISGYLKSIEQLLYKIIMINIDNNCKITVNKSLIKQNSKNNITTYIRDTGSWQICSENKRFLYIDLTSDQKEYIDTSLGTFEHFLRFNPSIFIDPSLAETVTKLISCFRKECRNGFFHTHNLNNWNTVEQTRSNAIYLYFVLLGGCNIPESRLKELEILHNDDFDELCIKIREFSRHSFDFIFEYPNGKKIKLIYDQRNNTIHHTKDGLEHYEHLLFYEVDDFSYESYEKLDNGIIEEQKIYLSRKSLPKRILGIKNNSEAETIL